MSNNGAKFTLKFILAIAVAIIDHKPQTHFIGSPARVPRNEVAYGRQPVDTKVSGTVRPNDIEHLQVWHVHDGDITVVDNMNDPVS